MERVAVPFSLERWALDLKVAVTVRGVVRAEPDALVIEFRETTMDMGSLAETDGEVHEIRIPVDDLESVEATRRWPGRTKLRIRTRRMSALAGVPATAGNECVLPVRRRDRLRARELAVSLSLHLSGRELKRIEEGGE